MKYCTKCFMPETRPRITFDEYGVCNACQWSERKKNIDWQERQLYFAGLCDTYRGNGTSPDCIVPWSGGKDSIYVAYKMREFGMKPLLVTVIPHLELPIGKWNRENTCKDFDHLWINLQDIKYRGLARKYFREDGRPKHPWETAISAVIINQAVKLNIPFIVYGEDGEQEYGGTPTENDKFVHCYPKGVNITTQSWMRPVDKDWLMKYYYQDGKLDWSLPSSKEFDKIFFTQYSRFENWNPSRHSDYAVARGMRTEPIRSIGTWTSGCQLSDKLQDLHIYLAFVKFGFGRCSADASIAIRDGWITKEKALIWVKKYDGEYPWKYHQDYLDYFEMTDDEFWLVIDKHANDNILKRGGEHRWQLKDPLKIDGMTEKEFWDTIGCHASKELPGRCGKDKWN